MFDNYINQIQVSTKIGEFFRFGIVGLIATAIHYGIYYGLQWFINITVAYSIGYLISFLCNFFLTSYFTFQSKPTFSKLVGMGGAHLVNYSLQVFLLNLFVYLGCSATIAPLPVFCIAVPVNFILVRFVFKKHK